MSRLKSEDIDTSNVPVRNFSNAPQKSYNNVETIQFGNVIVPVKQDDNKLVNEIREKIFRRGTEVANEIIEILYDYYHDFELLSVLMRLGLFLKAILTGHYNDNPEFLEYVQSKMADPKIRVKKPASFPVKERIVDDYIYLYHEFSKKIKENKLQSSFLVLPVADLNKLLKEVIFDFELSNLDEIPNKNNNSESDFKKYKKEIENEKYFFSDVLDQIIKGFKSELAGQYVTYTVEKDGKKHLNYARVFPSRRAENGEGDSPTNHIIYMGFRFPNENEKVGKGRLLGLKKFLRTSGERIDKKSKKMSNDARWKKIQDYVEKKQKTTIYDLGSGKVREFKGKVNVKDIIKPRHKSRK